MVWALAVLTLMSLVSLLFTFGVVEAGSPLGVVGNIGTPLSFLLVSILGILLWLAGASRWAAGLLIVLDSGPFSSAGVLESVAIMAFLLWLLLMSILLVRRVG